MISTFSFFLHLIHLLGGWGASFRFHFDVSLRTPLHHHLHQYWVAEAKIHFPETSHLYNMAVEQGGCCQQHLLNRVAKLPKTFCPFSMFDPWAKKSAESSNLYYSESQITVTIAFDSVNGKSKTGFFNVVLFPLG